MVKDQINRAEGIKESIKTLRLACKQSIFENRYSSLVATKLEEAEMWLERGIADKKATENIE